MQHRGFRALAFAASLCASCANTASSSTRVVASAPPSSIRPAAPPEGSITVGEPRDVQREPLEAPSARCSAVGESPPWSPPAGLDPALAHGSRVLFALGLTDPRGLDFVAAPVALPTLTGPERQRELYGWLVPHEGTPWLLTARGDLVPVRGPVRREAFSLAALDATPPDSWNEGRQDRARGTIRSNLLTAALLARLGRANEANARWQRAPTNFGFDRERAALLDLAEVFFDSALAAHRHGHAQLAVATLTALDCARPYISENANAVSMVTYLQDFRPRSVQERSTEFLQFVPALLEESRRRVDARRPPHGDLASAPVDALIAALDSIVLEPEDDGRFKNERSPLALAVRARGPSIGTELIRAYERDARLTQTIAVESFPFERYVFPTRWTLGWAIREVTGMQPEEFGWRHFLDVAPAEVARALTARWDAISTLTPYERALRGVSDPSSNFERQVLSVALLFATDAAPPASTALMLRSNGPLVVNNLSRTAPPGPALSSEQRRALFAAIRRRVPELGPLANDSDAVTLDEDHRCGYAHILYLVDPAAAAPVLRETLERTYARAPRRVSPGCSAWLSAALGALGDGNAAREVARRVRDIRFGDGELRGVASWWLLVADRPEGAIVFEQLARWAREVSPHQIRTSGDSTATVHSVAALSLVDESNLGVPPIREALLGLLEDTRPGAIVRYQQGSDEIVFHNARGVMTLTAPGPADGPDFVPPGTPETERIMDVVADQLVNRLRVRGAPPFDLRWVRARRDRTIADLKTMLRAIPTLAPTAQRTTAPSRGPAPTTGPRAPAAPRR